MRANRWSVLGAFAVGCLSSAAVFAFWRVENSADAAVSPPRVRESEQLVVVRNPEQPAEAVADPARDSAQAVQRDTATPSRAPEAEPPAASTATHELANANSAAVGDSAVSDVLTDLEAAYRQRLIAAARAEAEAAAQPPTAPPPPSPPVVPAQPPPVAAQTIAPVAPPPAAAPPPSEPPPSAPPASEPPAPPMVVAQNDARPPDIHIGDVNQNTYITNVRQGDVYVIQQQLALMQYMQMLGNSGYAASVPPAYGTRGSVPHQPRSVPFKSTLTNLDNPWGFNFAPPQLVH